jgi:hypothetical protein
MQQKNNQRKFRLAGLKVPRGISYRLADFQTRVGFAAGGFTNFLSLRGTNGARSPIAAVVVGRNDDYMSDFRERLYATLEWNLRYLVSEVVFVEWNPPGDRELLSYQLVKNFKCLRAYVVSADMHQQVCKNDNIKLLEYHAKNVGIRRAESPWIMSTNADAAIGLDAVRAIRRGRLDPGVAWTAERFDIPWQENRQQHLGLWGTLRYRRVIPYHHLGTGEFCLASRELWHQIRGYDELMVRHRIGCDQRGTAQMLAHGAKIQRAGSVLHLTHPTSCTETLHPNQGEWATPEGVPYHNDDNWGLGNCREVQMAERVWRLG